MADGQLAFDGGGTDEVQLRQMRNGEWVDIGPIVVTPRVDGINVRVIPGPTAEEIVRLLDELPYSTVIEENVVFIARPNTNQHDPENMIDG